MQHEVGTGLVRLDGATETRIRRATACLTDAGYVVHRVAMRPVFRGNAVLEPRRDKVFGGFHLIATDMNGKLRFICVTARNRMSKREADINARVPAFLGASQEVWGWVDTKQGRASFDVRVRKSDVGKWVWSSSIPVPSDIASAYASGRDVTPTAAGAALSLPPLEIAPLATAEAG